MTHQLPPDVAALITAIHADSSEGTPDGMPGMFISNPVHGTLLLDQQDAASYRNVVGELVRVFARSEDLSKRSVERALQDALFSALDIRQEDDRSFDERLASALRDLRTRLSGRPIEYRCFIPVQGLAPEDLPLTFGGIRFVSFGKSQRRQVLEPLGEDAGAFGDDLKREQLWGRCCAVVRAPARDFESAELRARMEARAVIDCINFFYDLVPFNGGWLYLPSEGAEEMIITPVVSAEGRVSVRFKRVGPLAPFSVGNLRKSARTMKSWKSTSALLRRSLSKTAGERLLTAIRWAGRATVETIREQSFLLFAIALESAVLPMQDQELNHRLSLRVSRLVGQDRGHREDVRRSVKSLYGVRSKIVHSGSYEVTDEDLGRLRVMTKRVLIRLLRRRSLWSLQVKEFEAWLDGLADR